MRVESCESTNKSFKALYMPQKRDIFGRTDIFYANVIDFLKPNLTNLAKDVDIYVKHKGEIINIQVGEVVKSSFKRFFGIIGNVSSSQILPNNYDITEISDVILNNVLETKKEFIKYKDYYTH